MAAAYTWEDVILHSRELLSDSLTPFRFSDLQITKTLNRGLQDIGRIRPDAFFTAYTTQELNIPEIIISGIPTGTQIIWTDAINIERQFFSALVNYVVAVTELTDDEFTIDGRAVALLNQFHTALAGVG